MPKAKVANSKDPRFPRLRRELGRLCTNGCEQWWVVEVSNYLLELDTVKARLKGDTEDARAEAVIAELREAVEKLHPQYRRLLKVVLALDERFLGLTAKERRTVAGMEFRDGKRQVKEATIRQHHEPKALDRLTESILWRNPAEAAADAA